MPEGRHVRTSVLVSPAGFTYNFPMNEIPRTFSPPVREWFIETFGEPTPPQAQGWPAIQRGDHTLILAPTGSGKTLAAFLWAIDELFRELTNQPTSHLANQPTNQPEPEPGVRLIYISPLKALNNDIRRNLREPLAGIRKTAHDLHLDFPRIEVAVRSGDTPQRERRAMVSRPPHIFITTPESFYLILTSPKARDMFRTVRTVIVDEIHTLAGIQKGDIQIVPVESLTPSPVAQSLLWDFINVYIYEWDAPKAERQLQSLAVNRELLQDLLRDVALDELLRPEAIEDVEGRLQHTATYAQARTVEELAVLLQQMGDLSAAEIAQRTTVDPTRWIEQLAGESRIRELSIPTTRGSERRWVAAECIPEYEAAFGIDGPHPSPDPSGHPLPYPEFGRGEGAGGWEEGASLILERFLRHAGPVTIEAIRDRYAFPEDWLRVGLDRLVEARQLAHGRFTPRPAPAGQVTAPAAEFVDRRTLEQIHRRTLTILRQEVQPVPFSAYADFLARWQHIHPDERLAGGGALTQLLQQLRAAPIVGQVWERDVLPLRLADYHPAELEALCQSGELVWIGSGGVDPRRGRVRFLFRGEGNVYLEPAPEDLSELSDPAQTAYHFLRSEGAVFFADMCAGLELADDAVEAALVELVMAGLVTNDSLEAMRQIVQQGSAVPLAALGTGSASRRQGRQEGRPFSALEEQLAERMRERGRRSRGLRRPGRAEYQAAKRRVRERLEQQSVPRWVGRWTLVHRFGVLGKQVPLEEQIARQARQLLARHGVVTRDSLEREEGSWNWSLIYQQLRLMEMRGEVRRGYFVRGLPGIQFALPEVVERLRAVRDRTEDDAALVVMNACDPANLFGPTLDGGPQTVAGEALTFSRIPSTWLVQHRGLPVLIAEGTGASLATAQGAGEDLLRRALRALLQHVAGSAAGSGRGFAHRVTVETWNGEPVLESAGRLLLESVGFYRDYPGMTWEAPQRTTDG